MLGPPLPTMIWLELTIRNIFWGSWYGWDGWGYRQGVRDMDVEMVIDGGSGNRCGWGMSWGYSISFQSGGAGLKMEGTVPFTNYKTGKLTVSSLPSQEIHIQS